MLPLLGCSHLINIGKRGRALIGFPPKILKLSYGYSTCETEYYFRNAEYRLIYFFLSEVENLFLVFNFVLFMLVNQLLF